MHDNVQVKRDVANKPQKAMSEKSQELVPPYHSAGQEHVDPPKDEDKDESGGQVKADSGPQADKDKGKRQVNSPDVEGNKENDGQPQIESPDVHGGDKRIEEQRQVNPPGAHNEDAGNEGQQQMLPLAAASDKDNAMEGQQQMQHHKVNDEKELQAKRPIVSKEGKDDHQGQGNLPEQHADKAQINLPNAKEDKGKFPLNPAEVLEEKDKLKNPDAHIGKEQDGNKAQLNPPELSEDKNKRNDYYQRPKKASNEAYDKAQIHHGDPDDKGKDGKEHLHTTLQTGRNEDQKQINPPHEDKAKDVEHHDQVQIKSS